MAFSMNFASVSPLLFFVLIAFNPAEGVKQELKWILQDNTTIVFSSNIPDLAIYSPFAPLVKQVCATGWWETYTGENYNLRWDPNGFLEGSEARCHNFKPTTIKSIRHWGAGDTTTDAISLYSNVTFKETEILVEGRVYAGITTPILSLTATGTSSWQLFEGQQLDGKSVCLNVPKEKYNFSWVDDVRRDIGLKTIGSVFKGCDNVNVEEYKKKHF